LIAHETDLPCGAVIVLLSSLLVGLAGIIGRLRRRGPA
jgi:hypothetical protein